MINDTSDASKAPSPLYGALDRFAQFFIDPLFLPETLDRELRAVDSENKKNLQSDTWRLHQLSQSLSNPKHPNNHFSTGNLQTLRDEPLARGVKIRDEFMRFHNEQYSANRMKLVVLGRESLDQLQSWVEELFTHVKNKDLPQNRWDGIPLFTSKERGREVFAKPVMETRSLELLFDYQDEDALYDTQPGHYLSHLIGHEGPGSILSLVKEKGWVNGLSAGGYTVCPGSGIFAVSISLTPEGLTRYKDIAKIVMQYISILHETAPKEWIFNELKGMAEVNFRFKQKSPASSTTSRLSGTMQEPLPRDRLLSGASVPRKFDSAAIKEALSHLKADNMRLTIVTPDTLTGEVQKEHWYGTEYTNRPIPSDLMEELRQAQKSSTSQRAPELFLPPKNAFIPSRLEVERKDVKDPAKAPKLIRNDPNVRLWFKKDDQFWVPKANMNVTLRNPLCGASPQSVVLAAMIGGLVEDALAEYAYNAEIAGLDYGLHGSSMGMHISLNGYNDKMPILLDKVLTTFKNTPFKQDRFDVLKERMIRHYKNAELSTPYYQIGQYTKWLGSERAYTQEQLLAELESITMADLQAFHPLLLHKFHIEALVQGNMYREDALKLTDTIERTLQPRMLPNSQWPIRRSYMLPQGSSYLYERPLKDPLNVNHCIEYMVQIGALTDRDLRARLLVFAQMTDEPAFDQLRTKEQLGYVVFSGAVSHITTSVYHVLIQSEKSPDYLEKRIDSFLHGFRQTLTEMSDEQFESHKRSIINKRREKVKNLNQEANRFSDHISSEFYRFDAVDDDVARIKPLTKADIVQFYDTHIDPSSEVRSKLSIHLLAKSSPSDVAKSMSPEQQKEGLASMMAQLLASGGIEADVAKITTRLEGIDLSAGNPAVIVDAMVQYLKADAGLSEDQASAVKTQAETVMPQMLPQLGIQAPQSTESAGDSEDIKTKKATVIKDVHAWKASLALSAGATPVRDLSEYEDLEPKL